MNPKLRGVYEALDRVATTEIRLPWMDNGFIPRLYEAARAGGDPITGQIAEATLALINSGKKRFGVVNGVYKEVGLPVGETDGPYGAIVLGRALEMLGAEVVQITEPEECIPMEKLRELLELKSNKVVALRRDSDEENGKLIDDLDGVFFVEKIGPSCEGVYHYSTGNPRNGEDSPLDTFIAKMHSEGKMSVGFGDFGNEIGFGKIWEQAREISPYGKKCGCPKNEGNICAWATDYLLPSNVSNFGAYAAVAALAAATGRLDILHTPEMEETIIRAGKAWGLIDGGHFVSNTNIDGIPLEGVKAVVQLLYTITAQFYDTTPMTHP